MNLRPLNHNTTTSTECYLLNKQLLYDDEERQITPVNTYSSSLGSSSAGNRDYMQQVLLGNQRPTAPVYDSSRVHVREREWKDDSKQKKHRHKKSSHTKYKVSRDDMVHEEERKRRHTDVQKEHVSEESPQRRDLRRQDSFISSLGLIVEEDETGKEDDLHTQTAQHALPDWNKESVSTFLLPQSTDGTDVVRKQAPSPPPPDF